MHKKTVLLTLLAVLMVSCGVKKTTVTPSKKLTGTGQEVINYGMRYLNKPYRFAGKGPHAFDCSGFTSFVFREFGYRLSTSSAGQDRQMPSIKQREHLQVGDLVFFEGRARNGRVGHVGIVKELLPGGEFRFLHASTTSGVIVSLSTEPYYASRYLRGGRILQENNALAIAEKVPRDKPKQVKKGDTRRNAFTSAKAKEQVLIEAPKTKSEKETADIPQNPETKELIVHSRPVNQLLTDLPKNKQGQEEVIKPAVQTMVRPDTISVPEPAETKIIENDSITHPVKPGETLYSISRKYNCSVAQLRDWNPQLGTVLKPGEKLVIRP
jgi:LysM repeat protein